MGRLSHRIVSSVADSDVWSRDQSVQFLYELHFLWRERSFRIVNIPIIVIKPESSLKWDIVAETLLVAEFFMYCLCAYLNGSNLWKCGDLGRENLKVCLFDLTFANLIELIILHICDMLWGINQSVLLLGPELLIWGINIAIINFNWLFYGKWILKE